MAEKTLGCKKCLTVSIYRNKKDVMSSMSKKSLDEMIAVMCGISDSVKMKKLVAELLTEAELEDLVLRWRLLGQLADGVPQREISKNLGISLCKITRGAKILKDDTSMMSSIFRGKDDTSS
jgi:TrpR family trp operon transcriptional repressor